MSKLQKVFNYNGNHVRTHLDEKGEPWFVAKDVCAVLDVSFSGQTLSKIKDEWQGSMSFITPGGNQNLKVINENAVYKLSFRSNKPEAEQFTEWVCSEVLPSIRKTGSFGGKDLSILDDEPHFLGLIDAMIAAKNAEKQAAKNSKRIDELEAHKNSQTGYRTVLAHLNVLKKKVPGKDASTIGRKASAYCKMNNITIGKVPDERYGTTNSYPIEVLEMFI